MKMIDTKIKRFCMVLCWLVVLLSPALAASKSKIMNKVDDFIVKVNDASVMEVFVAREYGVLSAKVISTAKSAYTKALVGIKTTGGWNTVDATGVMTAASDANKTFFNSVAGVKNATEFPNRSSRVEPIFDPSLSKSDMRHTAGANGAPGEVAQILSADTDKWFILGDISDCIRGADSNGNVSVALVLFASEAEYSGMRSVMIL